MKVHTLDLKFKGERRYLHGSDLFNAVNEFVRSTKSQQVKKIVFRRFATLQPYLIFDDPPVNKESFGSGTLFDGTKFFLLESDHRVTNSYPFDETAITRGAALSGSTIFGVGAKQYSTIENIIALTKALSYSQHSPVSGKWVFSQLDLLVPLPKDVSQYLIKQKKMFDGKFSVNEVCLDNHNVGAIRFMVSAA